MRSYLGFTTNRAPFAFGETKRPAEADLMNWCKILGYEYNEGELPVSVLWACAQLAGNSMMNLIEDDLEYFFLDQMVQPIAQWEPLTTSLRDTSRSVGQFGLILNHYTTGGVAGVRKMSNLWTKRVFAGLTYSRLIVAGLAFVAVLASPAHAQNDRMTPIATPSQPNAVELGTGPLPDAKNPESWHSQYGSKFARNVTVATLTPFLPDPAKASGAAVVVAPGGGFRTLSMENEGWNVARALAEKGVAAFVLKYRLNQTPADMPGFERSMREMFSATARPPRPDPEKAMAGLAPQIADARAAFALIRKRSAEWHVDPNRIGMVGFSAGAMLTMATALAGEDAKPAFIGNIYGPLAPLTVPADAPPLFIALAADDPFFANGGYGLIDSWKAAKRPVEFHLYEQGGHGFGMYPKETTSTGWFDAFVRWLGMHGMLKPAAAGGSGAAKSGSHLIGRYGLSEAQHCV